MNKEDIYIWRKEGAFVYSILWEQKKCHYLRIRKEVK